MSDSNGPPDSWDQCAGSVGNDLSAKISTLNVNAAEFIPNFGSFGQKSEVAGKIQIWMYSFYMKLIKHIYWFTSEYLFCCAMKSYYENILFFILLIISIV